MEIAIHDNRKLRDIQSEFRTYFPYLKIEFFDVPYEPGKAQRRDHLLMPERKVGACRKIHRDGAIEIIPGKTVMQLENEFWSQFGLSVQVFRHSGNVWIETSLTDSWSLKRQNDEGRELSFGHVL
ncbi:MAG: hypothetical protein U0T84_13370 [Chitinophagales bacterium]